MATYPDVIYVRPKNNGVVVPGVYIKARYLTDAAGNYVMNPGSEKFNLFAMDSNGNYVSYLTADQQAGASSPYIVPYDYDLSATYTKFHNVASLSQYQLSVLFTESYQRGGSNDVQRTQNDNPNSDFVPAFKAIASYDFGYACVAAGISLEDCFSDGGWYNRFSKLGNWDINISGYAGNNPDNVINIYKGYANGSNGTLELTTGIASPIVPGGLSAYKPDTRYWELNGPNYTGRIYSNEVTYLKYADREVWKMPDQTGKGGWTESSSYFDTRSGVKLRTVVMEFETNGSPSSKITSFPNGNWEKVNYLGGGLHRTETHDVLRREVTITNELPGNDYTEIVLAMNAKGTMASSFVKMSKLGCKCPSQLFTPDAFYFRRHHAALFALGA